jgi:outer membrane lipase/esterase
MTAASRPARSLLAAAIALAALPASAGEVFSRTVFFGDSLTDAGSFRPALIQFFGPDAAILGRFTTNPDPVWAQWLAAHYGTDATPANQGGDNHAVGGARTGTDGSSQFGPIPSVLSQVGAYLAANGGVADPGALYTVWAGANDLFSITDPATAPAVIGGAVTAQIGAIGTLRTAGARYILVPTVPDLGLTPAYRVQGQSAAGTQLSGAYNQALFGNLGLLGIRVIPLDTFNFLREVVADPGRYGFANVTGTACQPQFTAQSLTCSPASLVSPDAPDTYLFADGVHPTGRAHELVAQFAISTIEAPRQVGLLPHTAEVAGRLRSGRVAMRLDDAAAVDGLRWWADLRGDLQRQGDGDLLDGRGPALTVGADSVAGAMTLGVFAGIGRQSIDWPQDRGSYEQRDTSLGAYLGWRGDGPWARAQASYTSLDFDTAREVRLGPATRVHRGATDGSNFSFGLSGGWRFEHGALAHGPLLSLLSQRIKLDAFEEDADAGSRSTQLAYPAQVRDSLVASAGWQVSLDSGPNFRPYLRATVGRQLEDGPEEAFARAVSVPGSLEYAVPAVRFDDRYGTLVVGARTRLFGLDADIGAAAILGQDQGRDGSVFVTLGGGF